MIRILLCLIISNILTGCVLLDAYLMTKYDPNEYKLITDIRSQAHRFKEECANVEQSKDHARLISTQTELFMMYSEHVPRNKDVQAASKELNEIARELHERYNKGSVNIMFCKLKFDNIENSAKRMQSIIGSRPR